MPAQSQASTITSERPSVICTDASAPDCSSIWDWVEGKTAITLSALTPDLLPALVTAPKRVAENVWETEAALWRPDLTVRVASGSPRERQAALTSGADVVVIGRDNLADAVDHADTFRTFIIDEFSGFKNRASNRWKAAKKIALHSTVTHVWGLTGTPSPNGLLDLWPQIFLLDAGRRLGKNLTGYRTRYFTPSGQLPSGVITGWDIRPGAAARIHALLEDLCLYMGTEGRVELPPTTYNTIEVPLPPAARQLYKKMKNELVADMRDVGLMGEIHSAQNAAGVSNKLSQICAGLMYVDDADLRDGAYDIVHREKARAVQEIVDGTGSPVLVGYRFKGELDILRETLGKDAHTIDEPDIVNRWNRGEIPVLLGHPASMGHGLNLQHGGHTLVWSTPPWSLEEYQQMNKRLSRNGQKHPVVIHHLVAPFTVDQAILQRLTEKKTVQQALLDHLESPL